MTSLPVKPHSAFLSSVFMKILNKFLEFTFYILRQLLLLEVETFVTFNFDVFNFFQCTKNYNSHENLLIATWFYQFLYYSPTCSSKVSFPTL